MHFSFMVKHLFCSTPSRCRAAASAARAAAASARGRATTIKVPYHGLTGERRGLSRVSTRLVGTLSAMTYDVKLRGAHVKLKG